MKMSRRVAVMGLLLTTAFILSWLEMLLSLPVPVPGIKIGLANAAVLFTLYYLGSAEALAVLAGRLVLNALLFGNVSSLIFSAAGGILSYLVMCLAKRTAGNHIMGVSILGGAFHNIGQLAAASVVLATSFWWYLPYLILGGIAAGALNGLVTGRILKSRPFSDGKTNRKQ